MLEVVNLAAVFAGVLTLVIFIGVQSYRRESVINIFSFIKIQIFLPKGFWVAVLNAVLPGSSGFTRMDSPHFPSCLSVVNVSPGVLAHNCLLWHHITFTVHELPRRAILFGTSEPLSVCGDNWQCQLWKCWNDRAAHGAEAWLERSFLICFQCTDSVIDRCVLLRGARFWMTESLIQTRQRCLGGGFKKEEKV